MRSSNFLQVEIPVIDFKEAGYVFTPQDDQKLEWWEKISETWPNGSPVDFVSIVVGEQSSEWHCSSGSHRLISQPALSPSHSEEARISTGGDEEPASKRVRLDDPDKEGEFPKDMHS